MSARSAPTGSAAVVVNCAQLGYAAGVFLLAPLGDRLRHRGLVTTLLLVTCAGLVLAGTATSLPVLAAFSAAWTALALYITGPAYRLGTPAVGLLALVGAASMFATPGAAPTSRAPTPSTWCARWARSRPVLCC
ncbi:hypothetical protein [Streptomyces sp. 900105755]